MARDRDPRRRSFGDEPVANAFRARAGHAAVIWPRSDLAHAPELRRSREGVPAGIARVSRRSPEAAPQSGAAALLLVSADVKLRGPRAGGVTGGGTSAYPRGRQRVWGFGTLGCLGAESPCAREWRSSDQPAAQGGPYEERDPCHVSRVESSFTSAFPARAAASRPQGRVPAPRPAAACPAPQAGGRIPAPQAGNRIPAPQAGKNLPAAV